MSGAERGDQAVGPMICQAPGCFEDFTPRRSDARYCSEACKKRAKRARAGADTRLAKGTNRATLTDDPRTPVAGTNRRIGMRDLGAENGVGLLRGQVPHRGVPPIIEWHADGGHGLRSSEIRSVLGWGA